MREKVSNFMFGLVVTLTTITPVATYAQDPGAVEAISGAATYTTGVKSVSPTPAGIEYSEPLSLTRPDMTTKVRVENVIPKVADHAFFIEDSKVAARVRLDLIREAKSEILISTHTLAEDQLGVRLLGELTAAAKRGVKVKLIVDAWEKKKNFSPAMKMALEASGVEVHMFRPLTPGYFLNVNRRMHDKLFIVDRKYLVQGDRNLTKDYYSLGEEAFVSKEFYFEGKVAKTSAKYFDALLAEDAVERTAFNGTITDLIKEKQLILQRNALKTKNNILQGTDSWRNSLQHLDEVNFFHDNVKMKGKVSGTEAPLLDMIKNAKKRIVIENPYIVLTDEFRAALRIAHKNGVQITVITNSPQATDQKLVGAAWEESREFLKTMNATIWEHPGSNPKSDFSKWKMRSLKNMFSEKAIHTKMLIVDDMLAVKSFNLDPRSQNHNLEIVVQIKSQEMSERAIKLVRSDITNRNYVNTVLHGKTNKIIPAVNCRTNKVLSYLLRYYL